MPYLNSENANYLVNKYADMILRISYMYLHRTQDAEDICQDVFMKMATHDLSPGDASYEKAWIIRTTINACKDCLRTNFWKRASAMDDDFDIPAPKEPENTLLPLVMELPRNYRISIYLHYYEGYQVKEIASIMHKKENTISAYLTRGRAKLKSSLTEGARCTPIVIE